MRIKISKGMAERVGMEDIQEMFNLSDYHFKHENSVRVDISHHTIEQVGQIVKLFGPHKSVRGVGMLLADIDLWMNALKNPTTNRLRNPQQFSVLLTNLLAGTERKHLYKKSNDAWFAYYVSEVEFNEERERDNHTEPAYADVEMIWEEFGGRKREHMIFYSEDVQGKTVLEALALKEAYFENPQKRTEYLESKDRYMSVVDRIGAQFWARGQASDNMDGNHKGSDSWYWRQTKTIEMVRDEQPSQVVVDVFFEESKDKDREASINATFWAKKKVKLTDQDKKDGLDEEDLMKADDFRPEVPLHPFIAVFDLKKHLRLKIHVAHLEEYEYDTTMADKLILQPEIKDLVHILLEHRASTFKDVVRGKAGGVVVLLTGPPGTGKTLTAEIYAEAEKRPLYSVQASQLGTDEEELENYLLKTLLRAKRWNAVMLLDEADVYIKHRGENLQQNSIVGVFLRVLEYHSSVLFMTTNRGDDIDDAIASRCIARIEYVNPNSEDQAKIWKVLTKESGIVMTDAEIAKVVKASPNISGRDVKNLLKLAFMMSKAKGSEITADTIENVKRFKPTKGTGIK